MNFFTDKLTMTCQTVWGVAVILFVFSITNAEVETQFGAAGWFQYGVIVHSTDTANGYKFNGLSMNASGAQIQINTQVSGKLQVNAGLGVASFPFVAAKLVQEGGYSPMNYFPYVSSADFQYSFWNSEYNKFFIRGGLFPFDYATYNQNFGLYLLRGPVYPGIVYSGFETKHILPIANMLGLQVSHQVGGFTQNFILSSETELSPFFDLSPAYLINYKIEGLFGVGAGVNFYHLIPITDSLTNDPRWFHLDTLKDLAGNIVFKIDSTLDTTINAMVYNTTKNEAGDTTFLSFQGTKLMVNAFFDIKGLTGDFGILGPNDLILYAELGVLGLDDGKAYDDIYGTPDQRRPFMLGFNLPAFNFLDHLALEFEWYSAPFRDNLDRFQNVSGNETLSPKPYIQDGDVWENEDDFKWSVHGAKVFQDHLKLSFQVANDHFRPGVFTGYGDNFPASKRSLMINPKDWYWMSKLAYFF